MSTNHGNSHLLLNNWQLFYEPLDEDHQPYRRLTVGDRLDDSAVATGRLFLRASQRSSRTLTRVVKKLKRKIKQARQWKDNKKQR